MTAKKQDTIEIYLEIGKKKTFAGALDWPGWSRSGRDETAALQALLDYGPRYAQVLQSSGLEFQAPGDLAAFTIAERLEGNRTTDFGAPDIPPSTDYAAVSEDDFQRFQGILTACWGAFDQAGQIAAGKTLRTGPRGGGRDVKKMIEHVLGAEQAYLSRLGGKFRADESLSLEEQVSGIRQTILETLKRAVLGELPEQGPRGGKLWKPRYFVRRSAWHVLDHAWELEDRSLEEEDRVQ